MYKYKIGQKVRIRPDLRANTIIYSVFINDIMPQFFNKICTVQDRHMWLNRTPVYYFREVDWMWAERMLCNIIGMTCVFTHLTIYKYSFYRTICF